MMIHVSCTIVARLVWWWYDRYDRWLLLARNVLSGQKFWYFQNLWPDNIGWANLILTKNFVSGHYRAIVVSLNLEIDTQINPYLFIYLSIIHNNNNENYGKYNKKDADDCWKRLVRKELSWQDNWQRLFSAVVWAHQTGESFILILCKGKGETLNRGKYRGLKLTDQVMELLEWVLDSYIARNGKIVNIDEMTMTMTMKISLLPKLNNNCIRHIYIIHK